LVGRNGAGKTTMTKVLAGVGDDRDGHTFHGDITRQGQVGYLPQDPRTGDPDQSARARILDARGLGSLRNRMNDATERMALDGETGEAAMREYSRLEDRFLSLGGYAAEAEGNAIASNLKLPERILDQPL